ncbi:MAG: DUF4215 domain-containing protein [Myxococcota bacterium]|nr:DUF4215 domain-containing protein [Myxococcota bacterium]
MNRGSKTARYRPILIVLWLIPSWGCHQEVDFSRNAHPCGKCRDCDRCIYTGDAYECEPREEYAYKGCGDDGNVHYFNSCDEITPYMAEECTSNNSICVELWHSKAECRCVNHWVGEDCDVCPDNWDADQDCDACKYHWTGQDCETCPGNWDPSRECNVCIGNWDEAQDCAACQNGWIGDNCNICPEGWAADQDCIEVCGNGFITPSEQCEDLNDVQWDGCNACRIAEFQVNTYSHNDQAGPAVAMASDSRFVVVWQSRGQDGAEGGIFGEYYKNDGKPAEGEFQINTYTHRAQIDPTVAMAPDGRFVVVWQSYGQDGSGNGVFGQRYDVAGNPLGVEFQNNTYTANSQERPAVAMASDGRFVSVWQSESQDGNQEGVFGQRYDANGNPLGKEFQVNTYTDNVQEAPAVAMAADGPFIIVWQSYDQDGSSYGIFGQRYESNGNPEGDEFQVNTCTNYSQKQPDVAMAQDGRFVVVWEGFDQDGSSYGIFGQRYGSNGNPEGDEFQVNTYTVNAQERPAVAMAADGTFAVIWESRFQNGSHHGILGQRFDPAGNPVGDEFQVNTYTDSVRSSPAVALGSDGRLVAVWESDGQDGDDLGIFAQRYGADGMPLGLLPW